MLKIGSIGQPGGRRKPSRFDGLVDSMSTNSTDEKMGNAETLYKHYLQVIYTPVRNHEWCLF